MQFKEKSLYFSPYRVSTITCNADIGTNININMNIMYKYFELKNKDIHLTNKLADYFNKFYNFCFELNEDIVLKGRINFKY